MMLIGVLSDTHMPKMARRLPSRLVQKLKKADLILHAGDWCSLAVWEELSAIAPVEGVAGNNDGSDIVRRFGYKKRLELEGVRIGIVHGHQPLGRSGTERNAMSAFADNPVHVIIFGHSHIPVCKTVGHTLLFNPGSPTDKRRQPQYSFGLLHIHDGKVKAEHLFFKDKT